MRTYYLAAHIFLAIQNQGVSADFANTTALSHSVAAALISDTLVNTTLVNGSTGWPSFDVTQPTVSGESLIVQDSHSVISASEFAEVELRLGGLRGSGVIELTSFPAAVTMSDDASGIASPQCTPTVRTMLKSLPAGSQSNATLSNNVTSLAALLTPTSLFNNTNFNISRLLTFAAPMPQTLSGEPIGRPRARSYRSLVVAVASICFILFS